MAFDTPTLLATSIYVTGLLGGLLLFTWAQTRSGTALAVAGMTFLLIALGIGLLSVHGEAGEFVSITLAGGVFALAHGLLYSSVRMFNHRPPIFLSASVGAILWLVASETELVSTSQDARAVVISLIIAGYSLLLAVEFWRMRKERLPSARAASLLAGAHGLFFLARAAFILGWAATPAATAFAQSWSSILAFEALTAAVVLAFLLMSMSKERAEAGYKRAALVDYLTGVSNRRAFMEEADRTIAREAHQARTLSLLIFDLDHFKRINDEYGHPVGDLVLKSFTEVATRMLPDKSIFGRLGGEEFAALVTGIEVEEAYYLGERIRQAFADVTIAAEGREVNATASVGVVSSPQAHVGLQELLSGADAALYIAKSEGRNRVRVHGLDSSLIAGMRRRAHRDATALKRVV
jgi:diguanylate cyclase (GGDEF)-like protein